jgi:hypothetical protein
VVSWRGVHGSIPEEEAQQLKDNVEGINPQDLFYGLSIAECPLDLKEGLCFTELVSSVFLNRLDVFCW